MRSVGSTELVVMLEFLVLLVALLVIATAVVLRRIAKRAGRPLVFASRPCGSCGQRVPDLGSFCPLCGQKIV